MSDKYLVLNRHPFTDKAVRRYFATLAYHRTLLHLDKGPDFGIRTDGAPVQIDQIWVKYLGAVGYVDVIERQHHSFVSFWTPSDLRTIMFQVAIDSNEAPAPHDTL